MKRILKPSLSERYLRELAKKRIRIEPGEQAGSAPLPPQFDEELPHFVGEDVIDIAVQPGSPTENELTEPRDLRDDTTQHRIQQTSLADALRGVFNCYKPKVRFVEAVLGV